jgi:hypothetical protein
VASSYAQLPVTKVPDAAIAPNCDYPMAAQYTGQGNWYINRHKFGRR